MTAPSVAKPCFGLDAAWLAQYMHYTRPEFFAIFLLKKMSAERLTDRQPKKAT